MLELSISSVPSSKTGPFHTPFNPSIAIRNKTNSTLEAIDRLVWLADLNAQVLPSYSFNCCKLFDRLVKGLLHPGIFTNRRRWLLEADSCTNDCRKIFSSLKIISENSSLHNP